MNEVRLPSSNCPHCGHFTDAATGVGNDAAPKPGDFSICCYCGEFSAYTDDLTLRASSFAEVEKFVDDATARLFMRARKIIKGNLK